VVLPVSANTREEAAHTAEWAKDHQDARILLVTSAWHMPRAIRNFEDRNVSVAPLPCDYSGVSALESYREKGPEWLPTLGHIGALQLWWTEMAGRMLAR